MEQSQLTLATLHPINQTHLEKEKSRVGKTVPTDAFQIQTNLKAGRDLKRE